MKQILFLCDPCNDQGEQSPATHTGLSILIGNQRKPKYLDLCDEHQRTIVQPVIDAVSQWGYADDAPAKKTATPAGA